GVTVCGLPPALLTIVSAPARTPDASGVNVKSIAQLPPLASVDGHTEVNAKSPPTPIDEMLSEPGPLSVTITVCGELVVLIVRAGKVSVPGIRLIVGEAARPN